MKVNLINDNFNKEKFNQKAFHPLQSWEWGLARKEMGIDIIRLGEFEKNNLKNVYTVSFHKIPLFPFKIGYLPRSVFPSKEILEFIYDYGKRNNIIFIKIEPYVLKSDFSSFELGSNLNLKIKKSKHPLFPSWTQILDITKNEEELLKNFHPKTRYNIKLAEKKGVSVKEMTNKEGFKIFTTLYFQTCKRQNYFGHDLKYHQIVFNNLKEKIAHILIAFYKNEPLSAFQIWVFKDIAYYVYGGSSEKYRNFMAGNLLMWSAIKFAKKKGVKKFDMWGSLPPQYPKNHPWAGFTRFKEGYRGKFIEMIGSFDLIINPVFYFFYNVAFVLRKIYLKFLR